MRIDKFLWCVRYYKTRNLAAEACTKNKVWVNNVLVKASKEVMVSDVIKVRKEQINYSFQIIQIPKSRTAAKSLLLYIEDKTDKEELARLKEIRKEQDYYRKKGIGRPSKKDRREIDGFLSGDEAE
jgi:ribosome-associated heat shock protein Hsp15